MSDLISRDALLRYIDAEIDESREDRDDAKGRGDKWEVSYISGEIAEARRIRRHITMLPTVGYTPVVNAEWLTSSDIPDTLICSLCGRRFDMYHFDQKDMPYCLCGAKMDLKEGLSCE